MINSFSKRAGAFALVLGVAACGDNGKDTPEVVSSAVDFGLTDCGTAAIPRVFVINNNTARSFTFTTSLSGGENSLYTIVPPSGTVLPTAQLQVMVYSKPIPADSAVTENLYGETITVTTTKAGDSPHEVAIKQTARGAVFEVSTDTVSFGALQNFGTTAELPITVTNVGNAPAKLVIERAWPSFDLTQAGTVIAPGEALAGNVQFTPAHNLPQTLRMSLTGSAGAVCGAPATVTATGTGTAQGLAVHAVPATFKPRPKTSGGSSTLCVRTTTGVVACGGHNANGMRGISNTQLAEIDSAFGKGGASGPGNGLGYFDILNVVQTKAGFLTDVVELVSGTGFYCARRQDGSAWCWGDYLGIGNKAANDPRRSNPQAVSVAAAGTTTGIAAGYFYTCSIKTPSNTLECNTQRTGTNSFTSPQGWTVTGATQVAVAGGTGYAVMANGTVMSFGRNDTGERGNSDATQAAPSPVTDLTGVTQVATGGRGVNRDNRFGCARKDDATVWCWGDNRHGQLGNGTTSQSSVPVQVTDSTTAPLAGAAAITTGMSHACALVAGAVWCWGRGSEGEVGSGNLAQNVLRAEAVTGLTTATKIESAGTRLTCAVVTGGGVRCWGEVAGLFNVAPQPVVAFEP